MDVNLENRAMKSTLLAQALNIGEGLQPVSPYQENAQSNPGVLLGLTTFISNMIGLITILAGIFFIMTFFLAAFKWLSAGGDSGKVQKARDEMVQGVIGLIIVVAAYGIIGLIGTLLGLNILRPAEELIKVMPI